MVIHGSITKAGKVRAQTPKIPPRPKKSPIPKERVARNYHVRFVLKKRPGQQGPGL
jgi:small subunit ribosomal protein S30e